MNPVPRWFLVAVALATVVVFAVALIEPSLYLQDNEGFVAHTHEPVHGWELFLMGPLGLTVNVFAWYANLFLPAALALLILRRFGWTLLVGVPGLALALSALKMREMIVDEAGHMARITSHGPGFYCWISACAMPVVAAAVLMILTIQDRRQPAAPGGEAA